MDSKFVVGSEKFVANCADFRCFCSPFVSLDEFFDFLVDGVVHVVPVARHGLAGFVEVVVREAVVVVLGKTIEAVGVLGEDHSRIVVVTRGGFIYVALSLN